MILKLPFLLAVMLLSDPDQPKTGTGAADTAIDLSAETNAPVRKARSLAIKSRTCDFDRNEGVILFEGDVLVDYEGDCVMCADQVYMFVANSNEMRRVVAIGNVTITNNTRTGNCALATFRRRQGEIEMFANDKSELVRLTDHGENPGTVEGSRIKFWLNSEQVEVENSRITVENGTKGKEERKFL